MKSLVGVEAVDRKNQEEEGAVVEVHKDRTGEEEEEEVEGVVFWEDHTVDGGN